MYLVYNVRLLKFTFLSFRHHKNNGSSSMGFTKMKMRVYRSPFTSVNPEAETTVISDTCPYSLTLHCSSKHCACMFWCLARKRPSQELVEEEVCCPAMSSPISIPAISSSVMYLPLLHQHSTTIHVPTCTQFIHQHNTINACTYHFYNTNSSCIPPLLQHNNTYMYVTIYQPAI